MHLTPLRYPGGKQKLTLFVEEIISSNNLINGEYIEPYAGGAGVAFQLLFKNIVRKVHLNDSSIGIYAFWYSVLNETENLCKLIKDTEVSVEEWKKQKLILKSEKENLLKLGFSVFYLNRCNRSGVITGGMIGGTKQTGKWKINARFNKSDLIKRVLKIADFKDRISLTNLDAEVFIDECLPEIPNNSIIYFDPPYYEKSSCLYLDYYKKNDHARIAKKIQNNINHKWILSYDGALEILNLYRKRRFFLYDLQYTAGKSYKGQEIFIFEDSLIIPNCSKIKFIDKELKSFQSTFTLLEANEDIFKQFGYMFL